MNGARPILLVADPLASGIKMHPHTAEHLAHEGYVVLHCKREDFQSLKVLAPCPFTADDVAALRGIAFAVKDSDILESIASRIEVML